MKVNDYELSLLVEAIELSFKPVKRPRGSCDKLTMKPPIRDKTPVGFRVDITKVWKPVIVERR